MTLSPLLYSHVAYEWQIILNADLKTLNFQNNWRNKKAQLWKKKLENEDEEAEATTISDTRLSAPISFNSKTDIQER